MPRLQLRNTSSQAVAFQVQRDELKSEGFQAPGDAVAPDGIEHVWKFVAIHFDARDAFMIAHAHMSEPFFLQQPFGLFYAQ